MSHKYLNIRYANNCHNDSPQYMNGKLSSHCPLISIPHSYHVGGDGSKNTYIIKVRYKYQGLLMHILAKYINCSRCLKTIYKSLHLTSTRYPR